MTAHFGDGISLSPRQSFRARTVEFSNALHRGNGNTRIADIRQRKFQLVQHRPVFSLESELIDDIFRLAVLVVVEVEAVKHFVIEIKVVWPVGGILAGDDVHNEHRFARILPTAKRVSVGVICRRIERDQRRFSMAGRARERRCRRRDHERSQRHRRKLIKDMVRQIFHDWFSFLDLIGNVACNYSTIGSQNAREIVSRWRRPEGRRSFPCGRLRCESP